jgi:hypothetical protein
MDYWELHVGGAFDGGGSCIMIQEVGNVLCMSAKPRLHAELERRVALWEWILGRPRRCWSYLQRLSRLLLFVVTSSSSLFAVRF